MSTKKVMNEVILSSDVDSSNIDNESSGTTYVWDIITGNPLACYKGGAGSPARGLCMLKKDFLISANHNQPEIILWLLSNTRDGHHLPTRMEVPSKISSLAVSPDGLYCIAGVAEKIYVWCISTGQLLNVIQRHYQDVVCIKFADNLTFVTGGEDNLVMVWSMTDILALPNIHGTKKSKIEPVHVWHDHSLPVTDIYVGAGGIRARAVSSSLDQTCKFWDLATGRLLCSLKFSESLLSVTMNMAENRLYAGGTSGKIYVMDLSQGSARKTKDLESTKTNPEKSKFYFLGHQKRVTCLSVSASGQLLVSGSDDSTVKIWNTSTGQCLRTLLHKGPVTNAFIVPFPQSFLSSKYNRTNSPALIKPFEKQLKTDNVDSVLIPSFSLPESEICDRSYPFQSDIFAAVLSGGINSRSHSDASAADCEEQSSREKTEIITRLQKEINQIKEANDKLFAFSVAQVLK